MITTIVFILIAITILVLTYLKSKYDKALTTVLAGIFVFGGGAMLWLGVNWIGTALTPDTFDAKQTDQVVSYEILFTPDQITYYLTYENENGDANVLSHWRVFDAAPGEDQRVECGVYDSTVTWLFVDVDAQYHCNLYLN